MAVNNENSTSETNKPNQNGDCDRSVVGDLAWNDFEVIGAICIGVVIGWMLYFVNRYRKDDVSLNDLGAIITALFGGVALAYVEKLGSGTDASNASKVFGAYGMGLLIGFIAYGFVLYKLVKAHPDAYSTLWFLDGRRKKLKPDEEIPKSIKDTARPFSTVLFGRRRAEASEGTAANAEAMRADAIAATENALATMMDEVAREPDADVRARKHAEQVKVRDELSVMRQLDTLLELTDPETLAAVATLRQATVKLNVEAANLKTAADAFEKVAEAVAGAAGVGSAVNKLFA